MTESDLLYGVEAIASYLQLTKRQTYHLAATQGLPTFKVGKTVCGRRANLDAWLADKAARAQVEGIDHDSTT